MHKRALFIAGVFSLFIISMTAVLIFNNKETIAGKATGTTQKNGEGQIPITTTGDTIYIYGSKLIAKKSQTGTTYNFQDLIGSNTITTNQAGVLQSRFTSYPYGKTLTSQSTSGGVQKYTFTGKEDDGRLLYFGARYYDPRTGRFTSTDPISRIGSNYGYAAENPFTFVDPDGKAFAYAGKIREIGDPFTPSQDFLTAQTGYYQTHLQPLIEKGLGTEKAGKISSMITSGQAILVPGAILGFGFMPVAGKHSAHGLPYIDGFVDGETRPDEHQFSDDMIDESTKGFPTPNILISTNQGKDATDVTIASTLIHEFTHYENNEQGIKNPIETEYIAYSAGMQFNAGNDVPESAWKKLEQAASRGPAAFLDAISNDRTYNLYIKQTDQQAFREKYIPNQADSTSSIQP